MKQHIEESIVGHFRKAKHWEMSEIVRCMQIRRDEWMMYVIEESKRERSKRDDKNEGEGDIRIHVLSLFVIVFRSIVPSILRTETRKAQDQSTL